MKGGLGPVIYSIIEKVQTFGKMTNVFQEEKSVILLAAEEWLWKNLGGRINHISQLALSVLKSDIISRQLELNCHQLLVKLDQLNETLQILILVYTNIVGNEETNKFITA